MIAKLKDICELIVDCPHSTAPDEGTGYPLIRTPNIDVGRFDLEGVHRVSKETYDERNLRAVPRADDLILAREAPAGHVAIIPEGAKFCLGQRTVLIRPDQRKISPVWLNYFLNAPAQQHAMLKGANGATVSHVNMKTIRKLPVQVPTRAKQEKIASVLSTYDKLIENSKKQIDLLEEAGQRLYKEWFVDFRFPDAKEAHADKEVPENWIEGSLSHLVTFKRGKTITEAEAGDGSVPVVAGGLIPSYFHTHSNTKAPVITISGSGANAGYTHLYTEDIWASDCSYVDSTMTDVLYFVYESVVFFGRNFRHLQRGSAQPHVYPLHINKMKLLIPPRELQIEYCNRASSLFEAIAAHNRCISLCQEARDRLLTKLINGEIEAG